MKKIFLFLLLFSAAATAQETAKLSVDEKSGKPMLLGIHSREALADTNFAWWFNSEYENYEPKTAELSEVKDDLLNSKIKIVLGTWCSDSRREVPRFLKILDSMNYDMNRLEMIFVDREKKSPEGGIDTLGIELVPTFIISRSGKELGRIVEAPVETLESDLNKILLDQKK